MNPTTATKARLSSLSLPRILLHMEGLAICVASITLYGFYGFSWGLFVLLLLVPDIAMIAYLWGKQAGAWGYNLIHTYSLPLTLAVISAVMGLPLGLQLALIWLAHIGMDRLLGYGLKYATDFKDTHLARV